MPFAQSQPTDPTSSPTAPTMFKLTASACVAILFALQGVDAGVHK